MTTTEPLMPDGGKAPDVSSPDNPGRNAAAVSTSGRPAEFLLWRGRHLGPIGQLTQPSGILPLVVLRVAFGSVMLAAALRISAKGWIQELYIDPQFHFTYLGFDWISPLPGLGMYFVFVGIALASICIVLGLYYRLSMAAFFLLFTYVELIDVAYYLNHYYFISVFSFILIFLPLGSSFSLDVRRSPLLRQYVIPAWTLYVVRLQVGLVYFYAGLAKLNPDWLLEATPLRIWLAANTGMPLVGLWFDYIWVAFIFGWVGLIFDLSIPLLLTWRRTRFFAYIAVIVFHTTTAALFNIGMFPWIMIACTLVFFSEEDFRSVGKWWCRLIQGRRSQASTETNTAARLHVAPSVSLRIAACLLPVFMLVQLLMPLRHWIYPGDVHWTEEGFRFAWKVMVMEKSGLVTFRITEPATGRQWSAFPGDYLTQFQEQQMSFQPDMILEFSHYLAVEEGQQRGNGPLEVRAEAYVSLNGRRSQYLIDPTVDLAAVSDSLWPKPWISVQEGR